MIAREACAQKKLKMNVYDLPIYREYYVDFVKIFRELDDLKQTSLQHKKLIANAYEHAIEIFQLLNVGHQQFIHKFLEYF